MLCDDQGLPSHRPSAFASAPARASEGRPAVQAGLRGLVPGVRQGLGELGRARVHLVRRRLAPVSGRASASAGSSLGVCAVRLHMQLSYSPSSGDSLHTACGLPGTPLVTLPSKFDKRLPDGWTAFLGCFSGNQVHSESDIFRVNLQTISGCMQTVLCEASLQLASRIPAAHAARASACTCQATCLIHLPGYIHAHLLSKLHCMGQAPPHSHLSLTPPAPVRSSPAASCCMPACGWARGS